MNKYGRVLVLCVVFFLMCNGGCVVYAAENVAVQSADNSDVVVEERDDTLAEEISNSEDVKELPQSIADVVGTIGVEFVGAFLGFLFAIAFANRSNRKQTKELDRSLHNELEVIYNELNTRLKDEEFSDFYCYQTPIWEINLASGTLALVTNSLVFNKYIKVYSKIQYAQTLEKEYLHAKLFAKDDEPSSFAYRYILAIDKARRREAEGICEQINKSILKEMRKCREKK